MNAKKGGGIDLSVKHHHIILILRYLTYTMEIVGMMHIRAWLCIVMYNSIGIQKAS
jgi:hypothetical protein